MKHDTLFNIWDDPIPSYWTLTVRTCECGQRLWWDKKHKQFHCLKPTCPRFKENTENE